MDSKSTAMSLSCRAASIGSTLRPGGTANTTGRARGRASRQMDPQGHPARRRQRRPAVLPDLIFARPGALRAEVFWSALGRSFFVDPAPAPDPGTRIALASRPCSVSALTHRRRTTARHGRQPRNEAPALQPRSIMKRPRHRTQKDSALTAYAWPSWALTSRRFPGSR